MDPEGRDGLATWDPEPRDERRQWRSLMNSVIPSRSPERYPSSELEPSCKSFFIPPVFFKQHQPHFACRPLSKGQWHSLKEGVAITVFLLLTIAHSDIVVLFQG
jgi:hypothetical protein